MTHFTMAFDLERVQTVLRASISHSQPPTQSQVLDISGMTHIEESLKQIQRMVQRRIQHAEKYPPTEVYNTLLLMHMSLVTASRDFVGFCTTLLPAVRDLKHYGLTNDPKLSEIYGLVRSKATSLYDDLVNPARISEKRRITLGEALEAPSTAPPPTYMQTHSLPVPQAEYGKLPRVTYRSTGLPTPEPSPAAFSNLSLDSVSKGKVGANNHSTETYSSQFSPLNVLKDDETARMTFISADLEIILRILDDSLKVDTLQRRDPKELIKALTLVHYCLLWGSHAFVVHIQGMKSNLNVLRRHPEAGSRAETVMDLLNDNSRLQKEREFRAKIMNPVPKSSPTSSKAHSVALTPPTSPPSAREKVREPVLDISYHVKRVGTRAVAGGGFSDVWQGEYTTDSGVETVAIKILRRLKKISPERIDKRRNRELRAWRNLHHDNITPFYGIIVEEDGEIGMVSPYYTEGNIVDYLKEYSEVDPLNMLRKVSEGVAYLHNQKIVHGDIKGSNVMINNGSPRLIDFGLAQFLDDIDTGYTTSNIATSLRWSAPELLFDDSATSTKTEKSDVYAFASLCVEIMTLRSPYHPKRDPEVMTLVLGGKNPDRPSNDELWSPDDELWEFLLKCWRKNPQNRPDIVAVNQTLAKFRMVSVDA